MNTEILTIKEDGSASDDCAIRRAAECIRRGGLAVFPTETVYGLGGNALRAEAAKKIYAAKGRPSDNPLIIHIDETEKAERYAYTNPLFYRLAEAFWPGPLTMILKKRDCIPDTVTGGMDTVAIRLPQNPTARALIRMADVPVAAPSANLSGHPSPTTGEHVVRDLSGRVDMILYGGPCSIGVESTVLKVEEDRVILLRPGGVTYEDLCGLLGPEHVTIDTIVTEKVGEDVKPLSPGMKYRHYAPVAPVILLQGTEAAVSAFMRERAADTPNAAFLVYDEDGVGLPSDRTLTLGRRSDPSAQAKRLFACLRAFDDMEGVGVIYGPLPSKEGIGLAVYNRLAKAAGFSIKEV